MAEQLAGGFLYSFAYFLLCLVPWYFILKKAGYKSQELWFRSFLFLPTVITPLVAAIAGATSTIYSTFYYFASILFPLGLILLAVNEWPILRNKR